MKHIKQSIDNLLYAYNPDEFFPVWQDGKLDNRGEFIAYKAKRGFVKFSDAFDNFRASVQ